MRYTPLVSPIDSDTDASPFTYGTSVYQPFDDPTAWPYLHHREARPDEVAALHAKLAYLQREADEVKEKMTANVDKARHLVEIVEDEGVGTFRFLLPISLLSQVSGSLSVASELLGNDDYAAAVDQLRSIEAALRLVNSWGRGEMEVLVPGVIGLDVGEKAVVVIETEVNLVSNGSRLIEEIRRNTTRLVDD